MAIEGILRIEEPLFLSDNDSNNYKVIFETENYGNLIGIGSNQKEAFCDLSSKVESVKIKEENE